MQEITLPNITPKDTSAAEGQFVIEPLYPGYGTTVGTALRRVLLSSLPGAAITSVKFTGVDHEFSTIPGVKEDVIEILLNLKQVRFRLEGDEPVTVSLTKKGAGKITAKDIENTDRLEVVSKDQHIGTLSDKKGTFDAELTIEKGRGYFPTERREEQKLPVGTIALDAIFTPVKRVNFQVENTRVGQMTNFDRLILNVVTDETISPEAAVKEAATTLVSQFQLFVDPEAAAETVAAEAAAGSDGETSVENVDLSSRTANGLINNDLKTMQQVAALSAEDLSNLKGLGDKAVDEVKAKLKQLDLAGE
ncbi:DNA-directed RNA polymerase subunit alpha [Patescibacteria group bacterium]|nr:DNA-directed RNA polymerase subunit alpha [Patescibacteria group bacterium]